MRLASFVVRMYSRTFRLTVKNETTWKNRLAEGKPVLICAWHQQFFPAIHHFGSYAAFTPAIMISQSKDGEMIAGVANRVGWFTARGSSSRGGKAALDVMIEHLKTKGFGAHILDGPTGPMGKVKAGAVKMALESGAALVPCCARAENAWFFNSWDRFMLPKPFSRVTLEFGDPIIVDTDETDFEGLRRRLEETMSPGLIY